jgi:predicted negative regulator of RcsB-dependent stress response
MAYDLQEQEQLAALKGWWDRWGSWVLGVATVILLGFAAYNFWQWQERRESAQAAIRFEQLAKAVGEKNHAKVKELAGTIIEQHARTIYAPMAALHSAKANRETADLAAAKAQLRWVIEKSRQDEFRLLARVRLAAVLLDEKAFDEALKTLDGPVPDSHATLFADRRGDVLLEQGKVAEARAAWQQALEQSDARHPLRGLLQLKLDSLPAGS